MSARVTEWVVPMDGQRHEIGGGREIDVRHRHLGSVLDDLSELAVHLFEVGETDV